MNKFVLAALLGAITFSEVNAKRHNKYYEDEDTLMADPENDDFADVEEIAPKKGAAKKAAKAKQAAAMGKTKGKPKEEVAKKKAALKAKTAKAAAKGKGKADKSDDSSSSDDERHEAYKDGERNANQQMKEKAAKIKAAGGQEAVIKKDLKSPYVKRQTT
eukprot:UN16360